MTKDELYNDLKKLTNYPVAYGHFNKAPSIPFIVYLEGDDMRFFADSKVYYIEKTYEIEVYTNIPNEDLEKKLENYFNDNNLIWDSDPNIYIKSEKLYMKIYYIHEGGTTYGK